MKIGLYILELLDDHEYVVLPGLGAFMVIEKPAIFHEIDGTLSPPVRKIDFSKDIKINDGILLNHYAHSEGISAAKALAEIEKICAEILYMLDQGETINFPGFGTLSPQKGDYHFTPEEGTEVHPDSFGLQPVKLIPVFDTQPAAATVSEKAFTNEAFNRKGKMKAIYWLLVIPVIAIFFVGYWLIKPGLHEKPTDNPKNLIAIGVENQTVEKDDTGVDPLSIHQEIVIPEETQHPLKGLYYLIGGSFKTRENAEQFYEKASRKGFQPLHLGEIGSFHVVALAVYSNEREAVNNQNIILRNDSTSGVWVYYIREP